LVLDTVVVRRTKQQFAHLLLPRRHFCTLFAQERDQAVEDLLRWCRDLDPGKTLVRAFLANAEFNGVKSGAASHDLIENFRQGERIDNVPAQFDRFRKHPRNLAKQRLYASILRKLLRRSPLANAEFGNQALARTPQPPRN